MAKILRESQRAVRNITRLPPGALEEFPLDDAPAEDAAPASPEPEPIDPEALRLMVLADAKAEAEIKVKEAYDKGYAMGMEAGRAAFDATLASCADALTAAAQAMEEARERFLDSLEPQVVELVKLIAVRVVQREARTDPELIHITVRRALRRIADRQRIRVHVHPVDLDALRTHQVRLLEDFPGVEEVEIEVDASISPGGCTIDSELMHADARLETLLENVLEALAE